MEKGQGKKQEKKQEKKREAKIRAGVKLTVHGRERFFGPGICELLEQIGQTGSIQAAAARAAPRRTSRKDSLWPGMER